MIIHGLQKMTLLDYPGLVAAIVFLGGCDFRCPFCHNFQLVENPGPGQISEEEFFTFLEKRKKQLDGVVITGGEPCLRPDLPEFIRKIKTMGYKVKLDTNGNHPDVLKALLQEHLLDYVAMDIKNSLEKYPQTIGVAGFDTSNIEKSIKLLMSSDIDYEFRTTVVGSMHTASDFKQIGKLLKGAKAYYLQQFTMRDTVPDQTLTSPQESDLEQYRQVLLPEIPNTIIRGV